MADYRINAFKFLDSMSNYNKIKKEHGEKQFFTIYDAMLMDIIMKFQSSNIPQDKNSFGWTNSGFARKMQCTERTISDTIRKMKDFGFIRVDYIKRVDYSGKSSSSRYIYLCREPILNFIGEYYPADLYS